MASNFKILVRRNSHNLDLTLLGDFDGTSACELLNILKKKCNGADRVFIHTSGLKEIYPFGRDTFQNNLYLLKPQRIRFAFTGKNATRIAPEGCRIL
jgi:hypothetical protein